MSYTPTNWVNGTTPLNAVNMNKIEQGIVGVNTGKLNKIPTITFTDEQVISTETKSVNVTQDQAAILGSEDNPFVYLICDLLEIDGIYTTSWRHYVSEELEAVWFSKVDTVDPARGGMSVSQLCYIHPDRTGNFLYCGIYPANKTVDMTESVGVDSDGRLWTTPSSSSTATTASLTVAGWSNNSQTVSVAGVTASNNIIVAPTPASQSAYTAAGIICTAQGSGTLTFTCTTVPTAAITVNVLIVG